jgi:hypothetical protein
MEEIKMSRVSPGMLQAAWDVLNRYPRKRISPGPGFKEAIIAALDVMDREEEAEREEARRRYPIHIPGEITLPGLSSLCTLGVGVGVELI